MSPPSSTNHDNTKDNAVVIVISNETTPLLNSTNTSLPEFNADENVSISSKVSSSMGSYYGSTANGGSNGNSKIRATSPPATFASTTKKYNGSSSLDSLAFNTTLHNSIRTFRNNLVRARSKLSIMIQHHTGSIGMLGSISIAVNSLTGPAMLGLPATFARSGIIPTISCLLFVCVLSSLCCLEVSSIISKVPGNTNFKKEIEYSSAFTYFWGPKWFAITQILYLCCILCLNISSIVDIAQVFDTFLGHWFPYGGTAAIQIQWITSNYTSSVDTIDSTNNMFIQSTTSGTTNDDLILSDIPPTVSPITFNWIRWDYSNCTDDDLVAGVCSPFCHVPGLLLTAGKLLTVLVYLPLSLMDLKENAHYQIIAFIVLVFCTIHFSFQFIMIPEFNMYNNISLWGTDYTDLLGVVLFNFALVIAVPAWLYEREPHVDVPTVIHTSSAMAFFFYILIGVLGCAAIPNVSENMLQSMLSGTYGIIMQLSASIFAFAIIGLGIPLFSVLTRLNLTSTGLCTTNVGNVFAVYLPFTVSMFLYDGTDITTLLNWGGVIFTSLVVFLLPLLLAIHVTTDYFDYTGSIPVYCGYITTKRSQITMQLLLFVAATIAVISAVIGNFYSVVKS